MDSELAEVEEGLRWTVKHLVKKKRFENLEEVLLCNTYFCNEMGKYYISNENIKSILKLRVCRFYQVRIISVRFYQFSSF
jgi:hypothetical protein